MEQQQAAAEGDGAMQYASRGAAAGMHRSHSPLLGGAYLSRSSRPPATSASVTPSASCMSEESDISHGQQWWLPQPKPSLDEEHAEWRPAPPLLEALQCRVCSDLLKEAITAAECGHSCELGASKECVRVRLWHAAALRMLSHPHATEGASLLPPAFWGKGGRTFFATARAVGNIVFSLCLLFVASQLM